MDEIARKMGRPSAVAAGLMEEPVPSMRCTERQLKAHGMRAAGATWDEIGLALGVSGATARTHAAAAVRNGMPGLGGKLGEVHVTPEKTMGDAAAAVMLGSITHEGVDVEKFALLAQEAGIPPRMATGLLRRIRTSYGLFTAELREMKALELSEETYRKAQLILSYVDDTVLAGAGVKDLAYAYSALIDKAQLLGGKPTGIVDFNIRRKLEVLMPEFMAEARRRGITIEGSATVQPDEDT